MIEFPVFHVLSKNELHTRKIVTPLDVNKPEAEEQKATHEENEPLPSYYEIEKALKSDIIEGILKAGEAEKENEKEAEE